MLRLLVNLVILLLVLRILRPVLRGAGTFFKNVIGSKPAGGAPPSNKSVDYSDLSPYEIEDAEFEEVPKKGE